MPLPTPNAGESHDDWIDRCMANPTMNREYPDTGQRRAICESQWGRRGKQSAELRTHLPRMMRAMEGNEVIFATDGGSDKKARRFNMLAYTGNEVETWGGRMILDLTGAQLGAKRKPILRDHNPDKIVGYSESVERAEDGIRMAGRITDRTKDGEEVAGLSDDGFPWQASVGFEIQRVERIKEGDTKDVNARAFSGPGYIVTKWKLREASFVPLGADDQTVGMVLAVTDDDGLIEVEVKEAEMPEPKDPVKDFAAEHGEAVEQWKAEGCKEGEKLGYEQGVKDERARHAALIKAFSGRPEFVCDQFSKGHAVPVAKGELADVLAEEMKAKDARIEELEAGTIKDGDGQEGVRFGGAPEKQDKPDTSKMGPDERARVEWDVNHEGCKDQFSSFEGYLRFVQDDERYRRRAVSQKN